MQIPVMKPFVYRSLAGLSVLCLFACSHGDKPAASEPAARTSADGPFEEFTGEIVKEPIGYRFKPSDSPESLMRLTRAKAGRDFQSDELPLRKYFGKIIVVAGNGWIARAQIVGQWLRPGETRGPTLTGPEPKPH